MSFSHCVYRLDRPAVEFFEKFMLDNLEILEGEFLEHRIDPIKYPDFYFTAELEEPHHYKVVEEIVENRGVISRPIVEKWIKEEISEYDNY